MVEECRRILCWAGVPSLALLLGRGGRADHNGVFKISIKGQSINLSHVIGRKLAEDATANDQVLVEFGINAACVQASILGTYRLLDRVDAALSSDGVDPLCQIVELANLSSMIGDIFGAELAKHSRGRFRRNGPHRFPDLLSNAGDPERDGIEIKMALNRNNPKGHLAKPGRYITCRYVLITANGAPCLEKVDRPKATTAAIWEVRAGHLDMCHFNISNTDGDSGKTAVVNAGGMDQLKVVYVDLALFPGTRNGKVFLGYRSLLGF